VFSLHSDCHDLDVELMIKRLPRENELQCEPAGMVDVKTGESRPSSMVAHQVFCCGFFFCIPFPGMYANCIAGRNKMGPSKERPSAFARSDSFKAAVAETDAFYRV